MITSLRRKGFLQQSTKASAQVWMKKERGQVNWVVGLFQLLFVALLLCTTIQSERFRAASLYAEDALAASNLASALIDLEEYGISHRILIADPKEAYLQYMEALKENLNLNREWKGKEKSVIVGPVSVEKYIVYNVAGDIVWVYQYGAHGENIRQECFGTVKAPDGTIIENTSVYSEIRFAVNVVPGVSVQAYKGKLVDVAANNEFME